MKGMMIMNYHTFETSYQLTSNEMNVISKILRNAGGKFYDDKNEFVPTKVYEGIRKKGIIITLRTYCNDDYKYYFLQYRINPRRVMEHNNYIGLFNSKDTDIMLDKADKYLHSVNTNMPSVNYCKLNRIDFCCNIELSSQKEIYDYIKILQRGYYPNKYSPETYYDKTAKRYKFAKETFTGTYKDILSVTYYNKYKQLKENPYCQNTEDAKNILRAEIQCGKKKVKHLINKFGCTSIKTFLNNSDRIGEYVFSQYANKFYGSGDFYKLDEIYNIIDNSEFKQKSKRVMKNVVKLSANHSSLDKAFKELKMSRNDIKKVMNKFNKIKISPVVIPRRFKFDMFINPLTLALENSNLYDNNI